MSIVKPIIFKTAMTGIKKEQSMLSTGLPDILLWKSNEKSLIVPNSWANRPNFNIISKAASENGWPIYKRSSGGGAVPQGKSTLNLAIILPCPNGFTLEDGYRAICGIIINALAKFKIIANIGACDGSFCDGKWNVIIAGRKFAGTAQYWRSRANRRIALIHAAILVELPDKSVWKRFCNIQDFIDHSHMQSDLQNIKEYQAIEEFKKAEISPTRIRPNVHIALNDILPSQIAVKSFFSEITKASENFISNLTWKQHQ